MNLYGLSPDEVRRAFDELGLPAFRSRQVCHWVYRRDVTDFEEMTNLSKALRLDLSGRFRFDLPDLVDVSEARDGSRKYVLRLEDGARIESVLIRGGKRPAICLSSQVGCAMGCGFCRTAEMGLVRNLTSAEILAQLTLVRREAVLSSETLNLVFMGMGEPLHNVEAVVAAVRRLTDPEGFGISPRRITVSTVGWKPGLDALSEAELGVKVALSVTAADPDLRTQLIPPNQKYPIQTLLPRTRVLGRRHGMRTSVAYVLLSGINDGPEAAGALADLLGDYPVKVNLIPFNPYPGSPYRRPSDDAVDRFRRILASRGLHTNVRMTHAEDVLGACGQLATPAQGP